MSNLNRAARRAAERELLTKVQTTSTEENVHAVFLDDDALKDFNEFMKAKSKPIEGANENGKQFLENLEASEAAAKKSAKKVYNADDIQILDEAPIPATSLHYDLLVKLKDCMSVLQVGQSIKIPHNETLRQRVYDFNKLYFPEKKYSVYDGGDNFIVFLNNK